LREREIVDLKVMTERSNPLLRHNRDFLRTARNEDLAGFESVQI
jgi:hypothetical protein